MPVTQEEFRAALSRFPSGITVVTARAPSGNYHGITVSAFCSVSIDPPLVLACIEKTAGSHDAIKETGFFVVNVLGAGQDELSVRFALTEVDKFDGVSVRAGLGEAPVLEDALVTLECRLRDAFDGGDHTIFVGEVDTAAIRDGDPLVYFHGAYRDILTS